MLKRAQLLSKGSRARMLQTATELWHGQDFDQYFELMERVCRLDPANHGLLLDLGSAYGMRYDYAAAERCFERAARVAPDRATALAMAGMQCRNFSRYELARHYFERAIAEKSSPPDTFVKLAELYERFHFLDEAGKLVERALQMDSACALALLARARLDRASGRLEEAERVVRPLLSKTTPDTWSTRIRGWYELGAILDRQGRYDEAMTAFLEAKAMIRPNAANYLASQRLVHLRLKEAEANITADVLRRWFDSGAESPPPRRLALLCGHPRSGTTLLEQVLDSHPDIVSAEETAIFFETYLSLKRGLPNDALLLSVLDSASSAALQQAREHYYDSMDRFLGNSANDRLLVDKNPSLTGLVPGLVRVLPETKFLVALRDPWDVCLSCFMQPLPLNQVSAIFLSLEGAVEEYASLMGLWRAMAPRLPNPWLEVRYEDLVEDLESVSRRVLSFLGVQWDECVLRFNEHARKKLVRSPTYQDVTKPVFKGAVGRWRNYQKHLEPYIEKLAPFVTAFGYE
ncbi:MAG TPA: sulfotransferase [Candidatus Acidoferrum sp.]|jgi:tetratricopeptide (TPR) repeat protein|nr:sulfotransferase [Candidatus Acidoferrum sp.]